MSRSRKVELYKCHRCERDMTGNSNSIVGNLNKNKDIKVNEVCKTEKIALGKYV
jgi:hypothetical protein